MRRIILILGAALASALLSSCDLLAAGYDYHMSRSLESYDVPNFATIGDACAWIRTYIKYDAMHPFYVQTPEQILNSRTGDCKEYALLFMYIVHMEFHVATDFLRVQRPNQGAEHALVNANGIIYDPTGGYVAQGNESYKVIAGLSYNETMYWASQFHAFPFIGTR